jgi:hypothetical protein
MVLYLCVLIVFSLHRELLKLILATNPFSRWFCHNDNLKFQMGKLMLIVNTLKEAGKSCVVLHNYYINNYKKTSTHNKGIQGKALSSL